MPPDPKKISVDLIVFDLDGTLADTLPDLTAAANYACRTLGLPEHPPEAIRLMIGGGERKLIERLVGPEHQDKVDKCLELYLDHYTRHNGDLTRVYPEVAETLELLSGKKLGVLSNKLRRLTQQTLEAIGIARFFAAIRGGGEGIPLKPAPDQLLALIADLGMSPGRTLMVGDKIADIHSGRGAGAFTAAVTYGYGDLDSLAAASPDFLLQRISQLPSVLNEPPGFHPRGMKNPPLPPFFKGGS
ncbi:MAG: HAD family hydrolase [Thermodesulfobacteriota bacterium]